MLTPRTRCHSVIYEHWNMRIITYFQVSPFPSNTGAEINHFLKCTVHFLIMMKSKGLESRPFPPGAGASSNRKSNTPPIFQVTSISHNCVSYPPIYSCSAWCERKRCSHRSLVACRIPVEVSARGLLISQRHEEAAWGESWSQPQIVPLGTTPAATLVVHGESSNIHGHSFHTVWE